MSEVSKMIEEVMKKKSEGVINVYLRANDFTNVAEHIESELKKMIEGMERYSDDGWGGIDLVEETNGYLVYFQDLEKLFEEGKE